MLIYLSYGLVFLVYIIGAISVSVAVCVFENDTPDGIAPVMIGLSWPITVPCLLVMVAGRYLFYKPAVFFHNKLRKT